jgi:hypothetical protein
LQCLLQVRLSLLFLRLLLLRLLQLRLLLRQRQQRWLLLLLLLVLLLELRLRLLKQMLQRWLSPTQVANVAGEAQLGVLRAGPPWWDGCRVVRL